MGKRDRIHLELTIPEMEALARMCHEAYYSSRFQQMFTSYDLRALTRAMNKIQDGNRCAKELGGHDESSHRNATHSV